MEIVILFGGGDGGGIIITANGIIRIPPYGPNIQRMFGAALSMMAAASFVQESGLAKGLVEQATKLAILGKEMLGKQNSQVSGISQFGYMDDDGVFTCGSTGPIIFVPRGPGWPRFEPDPLPWRQGVGAVELGIAETIGI